MPQFATNLTEGNVTQQLVKFSAPFLLSNLIQSLYNISDTLIIQWCIGAAGSSAVGISGQVIQFVTSFIIGFSTGATILISQFLGARKQKEIKEIISTLFTMFIGVAVAFTILFISCSRPLLNLLQTPQESFENAVSYLVICMVGNIFVFGYNAISAVLRGMGDSKRPLYFVTVACILNILLDLLFVKLMNMGVPGSALATVISQGASFMLSVFFLCKKNFIFDFRVKSFHIYPKKFKALIKIGLPAAIQNSITSLSFLALTSIINQFGYAASAAANLISKYNNITILPSSAMSAAISAMVGQNIGAGKIDRTKKCYHVGTVIVITLGAIIFVITFLFAPQITDLLSRGDKAVNENGILYMRGFCADYIFVAFMFCTNGLINGAGQTKVTLVINILASFLTRIPIAYLLGVVMNLGMLGIGIAVPCASIIGGIIGFVYVNFGNWNRICQADK